MSCLPNDQRARLDTFLQHLLKNKQNESYIHKQTMKFNESLLLARLNSIRSLTHVELN